MVCKNCGADLKPGIKYCLECGEYIEEEEEEEAPEDEVSDEISDDQSEEYPVRKKRKKLNLTTTDYLIYGGLSLIMVVSILVIIVTVIKDNSQSDTPQPTATATIKADQRLTIDDYSVLVSGKLDSTVQGSFLYVTDNTNYKFSFQIKKEDFSSYYDNQASLKEQLLKNKYEVLSVFERTVNNRLFLLYEMTADGSRKILYLTEVDSGYTTRGTIEFFENGDWQEALPAIDAICNSVSF